MFTHDRSSRIVTVIIVFVLVVAGITGYKIFKNTQRSDPCYKDYKGPLCCHELCK